DHLSAYGYARPTSPRFDRMARDFALFERAVAACSWTLPSLASQFTSRYPTYHGALRHNLPLNHASRSLFETLAGEGFTVLGVTGNDLVSPALGLARGFDALWYADGRGQDLAARLESALGEWGGGDVALFVHLMDPHAPYVPPAPYDKRF